jgi:hypothetical protein
MNYYWITKARLYFQFFKVPARLTRLTWTLRSRLKQCVCLCLCVCPKPARCKNEVSSSIWQVTSTHLTARNTVHSLHIQTQSFYRIFFPSRRTAWEDLKALRPQGDIFELSELTFVSSSQCNGQNLAGIARRMIQPSTDSKKLCMFIFFWFENRKIQAR